MDAGCVCVHSACMHVCVRACVCVCMRACTCFHVCLDNSEHVIECTNVTYIFSPNTVDCALVNSTCVGVFTTVF